MQCLVAYVDSSGFERGKHTQLGPPSLGSCRDGPPQGAAACEPADAGPRIAAAAEAAAAVVVVDVVAAAAAVNDAEAAAAAAAGAVPSLGQCERQVYC